MTEKTDQENAGILRSAAARLMVEDKVALLMVVDFLLSDDNRCKVEVEEEEERLKQIVQGKLNNEIRNTTMIRENCSVRMMRRVHAKTEVFR